MHLAPPSMHVFLYMKAESDQGSKKGRRATNKLRTRNTIKVPLANCCSCSGVWDYPSKELILIYTLHMRCRHGREEPPSERWMKKQSRRPPLFPSFCPSRGLFYLTNVSGKDWLLGSHTQRLVFAPRCSGLGWVWGISNPKPVFVFIRLFWSIFHLLVLERVHGLGWPFLLDFICNGFSQPSLLVTVIRIFGVKLKIE